MCNYIVTDEEIENAEKDIFKNGEHFNDEQKIFLKCLDSCCVQAYAGTGKTSTIVGKLHILAQKNVWQNGRGICVISHTNVAVDEIKKHVAKHYPSIMEYPNFIGTIQEFINKFLFIPYLGSNKMQIRFQDESRYIDYKNDLQDQIIVQRINNKLSQISHGNNSDARSSFFERLKTIHIYGDKLYARTKNGFNEYTDLRIKAVSQEVIFDAFKNLINKKHEDGEFLFIESFIYGFEYIKQNQILKNIISQRFQFAFLDEAQDCSEIQIGILKELFNERSNTVFQQIGDINQSITETVWIPPTGSLYLGKSERFKKNLSDFVNIFKVDNGPGVIGQQINDQSEKVKLFLIKYDAGKESSVLKEFAEILKIEEIPIDKDFFAISHQHKQLSIYFPDYSKTITENKTKSIRFNNDIEYLNLLTGESIKEKGSNFIFKILLSLLYKHFKIDGGSWSDLKQYLSIGGKLDILKKIILEVSNEILLNNSISNLDDLKNKLNLILETDTIKFTKNSNTSISETIQNSNKNIFIHDGISINIGTIHSVKGQTHNATLCFSNREYDKHDIGHALLNNSNSRTLEFKRYLYVASSRPKYLFAFAIENNAFNSLMNTTIFQNFNEVTISS